RRCCALHWQSPVAFRHARQVCCRKASAQRQANTLRTATPLATLVSRHVTIPVHEQLCTYSFHPHFDCRFWHHWFHLTTRLWSLCTGECPGLHQLHQWRSPG